MSRGIARALGRVLPVTALAGGLFVLAAGGPAGAQAPAARPAVHPAAAMCGTATKPGTYKHVILILEENTSYSGIIGNSSAPYINSVASACGVASKYHNITHDSLPNYLGLTDGATNTALKPYDGDCTPSASCEVKTTNLFNELDASGKGGWRAFDESMPSACDKSDSGNYAPKHNPAVYYTDISSATCKADDVSLGTLSSSPLLKDFASESTAPAFSFVTPNLCDDMHGNTGCLSNLTKAGDTWLSSWLPAITGTSVYKSGDTVVFIVWDEGAGGSEGENCSPASVTDQSCHVPLLVVAPSVKAKTVDSAALSHYSLLKTIEDLLGVAELGSAKSATSLAAGFNL